MDGMASSEPPQPSLLPFVAAQPLVDHHCHGVLRAGGDPAGLLNEAEGAAVADGMPFDSLAGHAFRRWCPPLLGLEPHASVEAYQERRAALDGEEVNKRFLRAAGSEAPLSSNVAGIGVLPDGRMWVGYKYGGVSLMVDGRMRHYPGGKEGGPDKSGEQRVVHEWLLMQRQADITPPPHSGVPAAC